MEQGLKKQKAFSVFAAMAVGLGAAFYSSAGRSVTAENVEVRSSELAGGLREALPEADKAIRFSALDSKDDVFNPAQTAYAASKFSSDYVLARPMDPTQDEEGKVQRFFEQGVNVAITGASGDLIFEMKASEHEAVPNLSTFAGVFVTENVRIAAATADAAEQKSGDFYVVADLRPAKHEEIVAAGQKAGAQYMAALKQVAPAEMKEWQLRQIQYMEEFSSPSGVTKKVIETLEDYETLSKEERRIMTSRIKEQFPKEGYTVVGLVTKLKGLTPAEQKEWLPRLNVLNKPLDGEELATGLIDPAMRGLVSPVAIDKDEDGNEVMTIYPFIDGYTQKLDDLKLERHPIMLSDIKIVRSADGSASLLAKGHVTNSQSAVFSLGQTALGASRYLEGQNTLPPSATYIKLMSITPNEEPGIFDIADMYVPVLEKF